MKPSLFFHVAILALAVSRVFAAERIYTPPDLRGGNPAAVARPKMDWFADVQRKFDRYGGKPAAIVFDGDSITNRWEETGREQWKKFFEGRAAEFGIEGDHVENLLWRLSKGQVDGINPKVVVIMIGTNNSGGDSAEQIAGGIKAVVAEYKKRCPWAHIILMGIFPRGETPADGGRQKVAAVNAIIKSLDDGRRVTFVDITPQLVEPDGTISKDMMPDSLHPTAKGYEIWAAAIQPIIKKYAP
jgi:lysophospholipase L1-like esterase